MYRRLPTYNEVFRVLEDVYFLKIENGEAEWTDRCRPSDNVYYIPLMHCLSNITDMGDIYYGEGRRCICGPCNWFLLCNGQLLCLHVVASGQARPQGVHFPHISVTLRRHDTASAGEFTSYQTNTPMLLSGMPIAF